MQAEIGIKVISLIPDANVTPDYAVTFESQIHNKTRSLEFVLLCNNVGKHVRYTDKSKHMDRTQIG